MNDLDLPPLPPPDGEDDETTSDTSFGEPSLLAEEEDLELTESARDFSAWGISVSSLNGDTRDEEDATEYESRDDGPWFAIPRGRQHRDELHQACDDEESLGPVDWALPIPSEATDPPEDSPHEEGPELARDRKGPVLELPVWDADESDDDRTTHHPSATLP